MEYKKGQSENNDNNKLNTAANTNKQNEEENEEEEEEEGEVTKGDEKQQKGDSDEEEDEKKESTQRVVNLRGFGKPVQERNYPTNRITTSKYTFWSFIPKNLYEQFRRIANFYFLIVALLSFIPQISPFTPATTIIPLLFVLSITAAKEGIEDWRRHQSDNVVNNHKVLKYRDSRFEDTTWQSLKVGDVIKLEDGNMVPADIVLVSSSEEKGIAFVDASKLDGESGLRRRESLTEPGSYTTEDEIIGWLRDNEIVIECEPPNSHLYSFEGRLKVGDQSFPLSTKQLLLSGCEVGTTDWLIGIVTFTGPETKAILNIKKPHFKRSTLEKEMNRVLRHLFLFLAILIVASAVYGALWVAYRGSEDPYLEVTTAPALLLVLLIPSFLILYNQLIPISLYVTLELVKLILTYFVNHDERMYDVETDTYASSKTSSLIEELGQINYIFADKTGTLTVNQMKFIKCSVNNTVYHSRLSEQQDQQMLTEEVISSDAALQRFLMLLATCHTVIPNVRKREGTTKIEYEGTSPDEIALVEAAAAHGFVCKKRDGNLLVIEKPDKKGKEEIVWEVLNTLEFSSERKRMSVIVKRRESKDGSLYLLTKGSDSVILPRLRPDQNEAKNSVDIHLRDFSMNGYRTLVCGFRVIDPSEYQEWSQKYEKASVALKNRQDKVAKVAELIEKDLQLVAGIGIEDKLQEQVPETIHSLEMAGIQVWVLTGDKTETAINIGYASRLLTREMELVQIRSEKIDNEDEARDQMRESLRTINSNPDQEYGLVIDGEVLNYCLTNEECKVHFAELQRRCKAAVCCRVSPLQKANLVKSVKANQPGTKILAIGDGANDVSMIRAAHIGVGISGREGMQAAMSSDYAIAKFRFLYPLLMIHGRYANYRLSKLVLYSFYKNIVICFCQFWFMFYNKASAQSLFDAWSMTVFNILFTALPPIFMGVLDQDVPIQNILSFPRLYKAKQKQFTRKAAFIWIAEGIVESAIIYFGCVLLLFRFDVIDSTGHTVGLWALGATVYTCVVMAVNLKILLHTSYWTLWNVTAVVLSTLAWFVWFLGISLVKPSRQSDSYSFFNSGDLFHIAHNLYPSIMYWLLVLLLPLVALMPSFTWRLYVTEADNTDFNSTQQAYRPTENQIIQEYCVTDHTPDEERAFNELRPLLGDPMSQSKH